MSDQYTKHSVSTDALDTLGSIISPDEGRDAIHLAVFNAIAGEELHAGEHVYLDLDGITALATVAGKGLGIVDPFLLTSVKEGEHFWLVVYPRQIKSLRHVWEHPSFPETPLKPDTKRIESERWLTEFGRQIGSPNFHELIAAVLNQSERWDPDYLHFNGQDAHGDIPPEFWDHIEVYTGQRFESDDRPEHFSCSC